MDKAPFAGSRRVRSNTQTNVVQIVVLLTRLENIGPRILLCSSGWSLILMVTAPEHGAEVGVSFVHRSFFVSPSLQSSDASEASACSLDRSLEFHDPGRFRRGLHEVRARLGVQQSGASVPCISLLVFDGIPGDPSTVGILASSVLPPQNSSRVPILSVSITS
jgi:hypothetical protein